MADTNCSRCGRSLSIADLPEESHCSFCGQTRTLNLPSPEVTSTNHPELGATEVHQVGVSNRVSMIELHRILSPAQDPGEIGRLNNYQVLDQLGAGGMGVVFRARDPFLDRIVAIKAMRPLMAADSPNRERFMREGRAAAAIRHDHVVTVYGAEETDQVPFLVMEHLQGQTLDDRIKKSPFLPVDEVLRIGREIADGLHAAHSLGLIHRDIKPANIWLVAQTDRVKILDFGIARRLDEDSHLTIPGVILGTPAYMSPEQARGEAVSFQSDLFSLGALLYRICSGTHAFQAPDSVSMLNAVLMQVPQPIYRLKADIPPTLERLIMSLLEKDPARRPLSAVQVRDAFDQIIREEALLDLGSILGSTNIQETASVIPLDDETDEAEVFDADLVEETPNVSGIPVLPSYRLGDLAGRVFGRFVLGPKFGQGRYGTVFRAEDRRNSSSGGDGVVLKLFPAEFPASNSELERFVGAMKRALPLTHPNLVRVLTAGRTGPYCWTATEYVSGESLTRVLAQASGGIDWRRALRLAIEIGRVLRYASKNRLLHREIRPSKIIIDRASGSARLNGLLQGSALRWSKLHQAIEEQIGPEDLLLMAPELIAGSSSYVDQLCDLYSLGVLVHWALIGQPPFRGRCITEMSEAIREGRMHLPSTSLRRHNRGIPREFEFAIVHMTACHQEDRYQSFDDLLTTLEVLARRYRIPYQRESTDE